MNAPLTSAPARPGKPRRGLAARALTAALAAAALTLAPAAASADVEFSLTNPGVVNPGSTGNAFDVQLTNTGGSSLSIGAFSFGFAVGDTNFVFTLVNTSTSAAYIFAGHSKFGPGIGIVPPPSGQAVLASDEYDVANQGIVLGAGNTVGLGRVFFDVLPGATPGSVIPVTFDADQTGLSNFTGGSVPGTTTLTSGSITVAGTAAIPEPSVLALAGVAGLTAAASAAARRLARRRRPD